MEFALKGINPRSRIGESLKYDVWSWRPLWHIIVNNSEMLDEQDREMGQSKIPLEIIGTKHSAVIDSLYRVLKNRSHGEVEKALDQAPFLTVDGKKSIVAELSHERKQSYQFNWNAAVDLLRFCKSNEGFAIG
ncbi:MAG: hypothetical protein ACFFDR_03690 [Candidatus Thorarchaeota archaeon]